MKIIKKQIGVAVLFLTFSIVVLSVGSYAWFAANREVTAEGMSVSVELPINILATLTPPKNEYYTSLDGFSSSFSFGRTETDGESLTVYEHDMLVPVTSADGLNFLYLPFRYIDEGGRPKQNVVLENYSHVPLNLSGGYFIDIPMYLISMNAEDIQVYVSDLNIVNPESEALGGTATISAAVRTAVVVRDSEVLIYAKDSGAGPLTRGEEIYYPMGYDEEQGAILKTEDTASYESSFYSGQPESENPYVPSNANIFTLAGRTVEDSQIRYNYTKINIRIWIEGSDSAAVLSNVGTYFAVSLTLSVKE